MYVAGTAESCYFYLHRLEPVLSSAARSPSLSAIRFTDDRSLLQDRHSEVLLVQAVLAWGSHTSLQKRRALSRYLAGLFPRIRCASDKEILPPWHFVCITATLLISKP